ncbi:polymorphic toxin type 50 domain-containing protein, partial [Bacillus pumilus]|uniref:polymorphic toxin type 50 domain-containing protein n=1 Tax=Bacillus pumilus TaxID=1408 RepID=UPI0021B3D9DF
PKPPYPQVNPFPVKLKPAPQHKHIPHPPNYKHHIPNPKTNTIFFPHNKKPQKFLHKHPPTPHILKTKNKQTLHFPQLIPKHYNTHTNNYQHTTTPIIHYTK